jgi:hypothetical protein
VRSSYSRLFSQVGISISISISAVHSTHSGPPVLFAYTSFAIATGQDSCELSWVQYSPVQSSPVPRARRKSEIALTWFVLGVCSCPDPGRGQSLLYDAQDGTDGCLIVPACYCFSTTTRKCPSVRNMRTTQTVNGALSATNGGNAARRQVKLFAFYSYCSCRRRRRCTGLSHGQGENPPCCRLLRRPVTCHCRDISTQSFY